MPHDPPTLPPWLDQRLSPRLRDLLLRARPWGPPLLFLGGFLLDAATLRRVDDLADNLLLLFWLLSSGLLLVLERRAWHGRSCPRLVREHRESARMAIQFALGALFSAYLIYYSQSASLGPSLLFCLLLAALMLLNEVAFERLRPDGPHLLLWAFCAFSWLLFALPVHTGRLGAEIRLLAGFLALLSLALLVLAIHKGPVVDLAPPRAGPPSSLRRALLRHTGQGLGMLALLALLIRLDLVPPVPLALAHAGVYREVERQGPEVVLRYEAPPWYAPWRRQDRPFRWVEGERVVVFTAIFAPTGTGLRVLHAWERQEDDGRWTETDRIPFTMKGGREGGWRSWTAKQNLRPGRWRVTVYSEHGDRLGRLPFELVPREGERRALRERRY